jgi:hypothetical protein
MHREALADDSLDRSCAKKSMKPIPSALFTLSLFCIALPAAASAENCRALPAGPDRRACAMREHPGQLRAKQERCQRLAEERGFTDKRSGKRGFVQDCMRTRQQ